MKISFMKPFKKLPHEDIINPFDHDTHRMGSCVAQGRIVVMYSTNEPKDVVIVDCFTGERLKVELSDNKRISWKNIETIGG
jgi:hypothetical protein